jgi:hypothetical protein
MKKKIKKIYKAIVEINEYFLLVIITIFVIFMTISCDMYSYKKVIEKEKIKTFELVKNEIDRIIKGYEKFLTEISKELSRKEIKTDNQILQIIRESYFTIKNHNNGWINIVWESNKQTSKGITQLGVKNIDSKNSNLLKEDEIKICKAVVREGIEIIGDICFEQSIENLEYIISQKISIKNNTELDNNYDYVKIKNKHNKVIYITIDKTKSRKIDLYKIGYIVLAMSAAATIVFRANINKRKRELLNTKEIKIRDNKIKCLEHISGKNLLYKRNGYLNKQDILILTDYFYREAIELNLNIKLKIREEVQNKEINTEILYKILMSLLLESINRIYNNGSISVEFKLKNLKMIEMRYTDNLYNVNIKEEEDMVKRRLKEHPFYLDRKNINDLLSQNNGVYEENEIFHKRKEVIINVPIVTEQLPSNIILIKSFLKGESDEV